jgi:glucosamine--fructose-6-phosphate aminotransferase (isomerizing)
MCGIIAVLRRPSDRTPPPPADIRSLLDQAAAAVPTAVDLVSLGQLAEAEAALLAGAVPLNEADRLLRGTPGVQALLGAPALVTGAEALLDDLAGTVAKVEALLDSGAASDGSTGAVESLNVALVQLKDAAWAVARDRLRAAREVTDLGGTDLTPSAVAGFLSIQQSLSAIDRLEVRGRDSAGICVLVHGHGLDLDEPTVASLVQDRAADTLFQSGSVRTPDGHLAFVYKAAAEIGELGDNTAAIRDAVRKDELLRLALAGPEAQAVVLGHTRWASVGIISQANAHPVTSEEPTRPGAPWVAAALNGDVDNFSDLATSALLEIAPEITTDAKVIPTLCSRRLADGEGATDAFRATVAGLEGSVAIGALSGSDPGTISLALRGSGQGLYVGVADDLYIVASEPYGLVEETSSYLRLDGETPANPENPTASRGQIVRLSSAQAGSAEAIERVAYDGTVLPVTPADLSTATITTRDIDRGDSPHFLLKEMSEAPASFRKTLRGRLVDLAAAAGGDDRLVSVLGPETLSDDLRARLVAGEIQHVLVIGQGTAAVAGQSLASGLADLLTETPVRVQAMLATELSGFALRPDMADTLVVAISQSGTTTDTNRTVDLARSRGATVIGVVNRRGSDLTDKSDGVLYTSDGRDVEMSVASTKAFYAQIAAGFLLASAIAAEVAPASVQTADHQALLSSLRAMPDALARTLEQRALVGEAARELAPSRRYWAIVGNGVNRVAASEVRIKLSELCYKSIACDSTEDKKHIDLSAEPLIIVCAAGLTGSTADDVAKEVAIYRAHKAAPIVIATEGEGRFGAALAVIAVPAVHPRLAFILSAMAGHLFGYEAALAIDAQALPLREARGVIEDAVAAGVPVHGGVLLEPLAAAFEPLAGRFFAGLRSNQYDGHLEAGTAVRLASLFRYALGTTPLEAYQSEFGKVGTPAVVLEDLTSALTRAIEELTRPIDAIKHQAKTVTVGISRADETLLQVPLVAEVLAAGTPRDRLSYRTLRTLADLDPVVAEVTGYTRYLIEGTLLDGRDLGDDATITVIDQSGAARFPSRTDRDPRLRGTKRTVAADRELFVARGRNDGRTLIHVPEVKDNETVGITLLHVRFADGLGVPSLRGAMQGYRNRYHALRDAVTETEPTFREDLLPEVPTADLLTTPINDLADRWRTAARP